MSLDDTAHPSIAEPLRSVSMNRPYPPRRTVFLFRLQAKPMRGAKSLFEEYRKPSGTPACAAVMTGTGAIDSVKAGFRFANAAWLGIITAALAPEGLV